METQETMFDLTRTKFCKILEGWPCALTKQGIKVEDMNKFFIEQSHAGSIMLKTLHSVTFLGAMIQLHAS